MTLEKRKRYLDLHPGEAVYEGGDSVFVRNWRDLEEYIDSYQFKLAFVEAISKIYCRKKMKEMGFS